MTGLRPIVDMTFMDFSVIAMDAIVNQAAKTRYMFGGKGQVPMTIRCAAGNGVGSAAQHSQSLESWFTHIPGLKVVAPGTPADMKGLLKSSIRDSNPVIILEYKSEFNQKGEVPLDPDYTIPLGVGDIKKEGTDVTVVTYGKILRRVMQAAEELTEEGISVEVVDPRTLVPLDKDIIINSVKKQEKSFWSMMPTKLVVISVKFLLSFPNQKHLTIWMHQFAAVLVKMYPCLTPRILKTP